MFDWLIAMEDGVTKKETSLEHKERQERLQAFGHTQDDQTSLF